MIKVEPSATHKLNTQTNSGLATKDGVIELESKVLG